MIKASHAFALGALLLSIGSPAAGQMYINEIFFNPGGAGLDERDEFIELRGEANTPLQDHYLLILENELDEFAQGDAGVIENLFDLGSLSLGDNGFLVLLQKYNRFTAEQRISGANFATNEGPNKPGGFPAAYPGFGNNDDGGEGSTIGASDLVSTNGVATGALENSGFTAMLIRNDTGAAPVLGDDLDVGNDGLDVATGQAGWTILDSIGIFGEADETEFGRLYGQANYGVGSPGFLPPDWEPNVEPGTPFTFVNYEVEHLARWGNSTGSASEDWHITNLTDNEASGSSGANGATGPLDFRQSGDHPNATNPTTPPQQPSFVETNRGVPYGAKLLASLGGPNYLTGDYNHDGVVDAADYTVWRDTLGATGTDSDHAAADADLDYLVDGDDYDAWVAAYGSPDAAPAAGATIPEPGSLLLAAVAAAGALTGRRR